MSFQEHVPSFGQAWSGLDASGLDLNMRDINLLDSILLEMATTYLTSQSADCMEKNIVDILWLCGGHEAVPTNPSKSAPRIMIVHADSSARA